MTGAMNVITAPPLRRLAPPGIGRYSGNPAVGNSCTGVLLQVATSPTPDLGVILSQTGLPMAEVRIIFAGYRAEPDRRAGKPTCRHAADEAEGRVIHFGLPRHHGASLLECIGAVWQCASTPRRGPVIQALPTRQSTAPEWVFGPRGYFIRCAPQNRNPTDVQNNRALPRGSSASPTLAQISIAPGRSPQIELPADTLEAHQHRARSAKLLSLIHHHLQRRLGSRVI